MSDTVQAFYDDFADDYHLIFADWQASMDRQAGQLDKLIQGALGVGPKTILDCACGIGTQAIGLARLGHRVVATDLSPRAVARAQREAEARGAAITVAVADFRDLTRVPGGPFDVVLAYDNALPHLLQPADLRAATASMASRLRPGGLFLASIRDYDQQVRERPRTEGPRVIDGPDGRRMSFQVWDWLDDGRGYRVHQFLVVPSGAGWETRCFSTDYRALLRDDLNDTLSQSGLEAIRWLMPEASGYYQPLVIAGRG